MELNKILAKLQAGTAVCIIATLSTGNHAQARSNARHSGGMENATAAAVSPSAAAANIRRENQILRADPNNAKSLLSRSYNYSLIGEREKAMADVKKVLAADAGNAVALAMLGSYFRNDGHYADALKVLNRAIAIDPKFSNAYACRANVQNRLTHPYKALQDWNSAIAYATKVDSGLFTNRGFTYTELEQYKQALPDLEQALKLDPGDVWAQSLHALCRSKVDPEAAEREIAAVVKKYPGRLAPLTMMCRLARDRNDWKVMEESLKAIIKIDPSDIDSKTELANLPDLKALHASHQFHVGANGAQTIAMLSAAVAAKPKDTAPLLARAQFYLKNLDAERAVADFTSAIKLDPKLALAYVERGIAYKSLERFDYSSRDFDEALKINPINCEALMEAGRLHRTLKQPDVALKYYNRLIALRPKVPIFLTERANILMDLKKNELALLDAEKAVLLHPGHAECKALAFAYLAAGQFDKAAVEFTAAIDQKSDDMVLFRGRAQAYRKIGKLDLAAKDEARLKNFDNELYEDAPFRHEK